MNIWPSRPHVLGVYPVSGLVLLPAELGYTVRYLAPPPYNPAHTPVRPQVIGPLVPVFSEGEGLTGLLPVSCSCVLLVWFERYRKTWVLSSFLHTGSNRKLPCGHLPPGQWSFLSFLLSFLLILVVGAP